MSDTAIQPHVDDPTAQAVEPLATSANPREAEPLPADRFADRELSWLSFNERVLELAEDESLPLLERAKFLAIFASNLDEFFMVRVAGLKRRIDAGIAVRAASGLMPRDLLELILSRTRALMDRHAACFGDSVLPGLRAEGIQLLRYHQATDDERALLQRTFAEKVFPVLTPLAVDPAHPFPYISGLSLNLPCVVRNPGTGTSCSPASRCPEPAALPAGRRRAVRAARGRHRGEPVRPLPGWRSFSSTPSGSPATRTSRSRRTTPRACSRLSSASSTAAGSATRPTGGGALDRPVRAGAARPRAGDLHEEVFSLPGPLDLTGLWTIVGLDREDLKEAEFLPRPAPSSPRWTPPPRTSWRRCATTTCCCTTRTTASRPACSGSSSRRRPTPRSWRSSRRCTARRGTRRSSTR